MDKVDPDTLLTLFSAVLYPMIAEQDGRQKTLQHNLEKMQKEHREDMESDSI